MKESLSSLIFTGLAEVIASGTVIAFGRHAINIVFGPAVWAHANP